MKVLETLGYALTVSTVVSVIIIAIIIAIVITGLNNMDFH